MNSKIIQHLLTFVLLLLLPIAAGADSPTFFVAPGGSDQNPGTLEKPLATIAAARDAVRKAKVTQAGPITVVLRGGTYYEEPRALTSMSFTDKGCGSKTSTCPPRARRPGPP